MVGKCDKCTHTLKKIFNLQWCVFCYFQIAPNVLLTDEEIEYRQKQEFQAFCDEENKFLRELGIITDDEPLPET